MGFFTVNHEKCNQDAICAITCPMGIISISADNPFPVPVENAEELCINCGHCVSVCPTGAFSLKSMPVNQCTELNEDWHLSPDKIAQLLKGRRSIRKYKNDKADREIISKIIDMARYAPSGMNAQPVRWIVVHNPDEVRKIGRLVVDWMRDNINKRSPLVDILYMENVTNAWDNGSDPIFRGAPHLVIAHANKNNMIAPLDAVIAVTYLELSALSFGLGSCWAGFFQIAANKWKPIREFIDLPKENNVLGAVMLGYPKFKYHRIPFRNESKIDWL